MTSITYGTLPSLPTFTEAYGAACNDGHEYTMTLNATDWAAFEALELDYIGTLMPRDRGSNKQTMHYTPAELYDLCAVMLDLCDRLAGEGGAPVSSAEWVEDFCGSVLQSLGFEWV